MSSSDRPLIRIGARRSPLAVAQATWVAERLDALGVATEFVGITTQGDVDRRELTQIGGTGVFASAVRDALGAETIDVAVHSAKDLPTAAAPGLQVAAYPAREDWRDVLIGRPLADLDGATIGTGSPRRASQLLAWAEQAGCEITIVPIRGNVDRRIKLVSSGELDATVLAAAGLRRLDRLLADGEQWWVTDPDGVPQVVAQLLEPSVMLPAAAQGALALEVRADSPVTELVAGLDHADTRTCVEAERQVLATLEAGCTAPVGVLASFEPAASGNADLTISAVIGRTDPSKFGEGAVRDSVIRVAGSSSTDDSAALGTQVAQALLARLT